VFTLELWGGESVGLRVHGPPLAIKLGYPNQALTRLFYPNNGSEDHCLRLRRRRRLLRISALTLGVGAVLALGACGTSGSSGGAAKLAFTLTDEGCSPNKASVPAGPVSITVTNGGTTRVTELELQNKSGIILGERENLTPGISGTFSLDIQPGSYVLFCPAGQLTRGVLTVSGKAQPERGPSAVLLKTAVLQYRTYVEGEISQLLAGTRKFVAAIEQGNIAEAKRLFGPVRIHYEAIEPVAESFVGLDSAIDARIDSPTVAGNESKWTGFHHIEQIMWAKHTLRGTTSLANRLLTDVQTLNQKVPTLPLSATQLINGSVELLNEIVNVKITGEEDRYSHTDLSDFQGNLLGARKAFEYVRPVLERERETALSSEIAGQLQAVQRELDGYRRNTPLGFALYGELTQADKVKIANQVGSAAQALTNVAQKLAVNQ
jgi:iron uptake system component EfeO